MSITYLNVAQQPHSGTKVSSLVLIVFCTLFTSMGQLFLKKGLNTLSLTMMGVLSNRSLLLGMFLYVLGAFLLVIALRGGELSVLYPIFATGYIWVSLLSFTVLGEHMNLLKWTGVLVILLGVTFIGYGSQHGGMRKMKDRILKKLRRPHGN